MTHLDKAHVLVNRCNRDYEGEIRSFGDTVRIGYIGDITIGNYSPNNTSITPEELTAVQSLLTIDQAKYFAFKIDDVDNAQTKPKLMDEAMQRAAYGLGDTVDQAIAALYSQAGESVTTEASSMNSASTLEALGAVVQRLDENNVSSAGRFIVVPPWVHTKILLANILQTDGSVDANQTFANGYVGRVLGLDVFVSNNITTTGTAPSYTSYCMAGTRDAITYAEQVVKVEAYRQEASFSDAVKGLLVYGYRVLQPNALVSLKAIYKAEA